MIDRIVLIDRINFWRDKLGACKLPEVLHVNDIKSLQKILQDSYQRSIG